LTWKIDAELISYVPFEFDLKFETKFIRLKKVENLVPDTDSILDL